MKRVDESRELIRRAMDCALGSYIEQEGKKGDQWRDQDIGELMRHTRHEVQECAENVAEHDYGYLLHNAMDLMELGAMLYVKAQEKLIG